jgi:hypothetical protein
VALKTLLRMSIGIGVASTLAYLLYQGALSAMLIDVTFGGIGMLGTLVFLNLAAKACPKQVEGPSSRCSFPSITAVSKGPRSSGAGCMRPWVIHC